jgi:hypothetical protein
MKKLRLSATITAFLGFFSAISLILLFFVFGDMLHHGMAHRYEWYMAGICLLILAAFTLSVFIMLGYLLRTSDRLINLTTDTGINK